MEKYFIVQILITLVVISIQNDTSEAEMDQVEFLWKEQNWQKMTWFTKVNTRKGLLDKNNLTAEKDKHQRVTKLKIITLLMGCGYGQKLIDFLWLTTYTVTALTENPDMDCWKRLERCLKKGGHIINKWLLAFKQIDSLDARLNVDDIPFHDHLLAIKNFLNEIPSVHNGIAEPEARWLNQKLEDFANSFGDILDITCVPIHSKIKQEELTNEYNNLTDEYKQRFKINFIHDLYEYKLDTAIEYISDHMIYIGFNYIPEKQIMTYDVPPSSAVAYA